MKNNKGFIQIPILIAIIAGLLAISGAGYFGVKQYQNYQAGNRGQQDTGSNQNIKNNSDPRSLLIAEFFKNPTLENFKIICEYTQKSIRYNTSAAKAIWINILNCFQLQLKNLLYKTFRRKTTNQRTGEILHEHQEDLPEQTPRSAELPWGKPSTVWADGMINRLCPTCHKQIRKDLKRLSAKFHCTCPESYETKAL